jgi:hypothetical protein
MTLVGVLLQTKVSFNNNFKNASKLPVVDPNAVAFGELGPGSNRLERDPRVRGGGSGFELETL